MAVLFSDGCDFYSATADLVKKWAGNTSTTGITFNASGGRSGGGCLSMTTASGSGSLTSPVFGALGVGVASKVVADGFWFKAAALGGSQAMTIRSFLLTSGGLFCRLNVASS